MVQWDPEVQQGRSAILEHKVLVVEQVPLDHVAPLEMPVHEDRLGHRVEWELLVPQDN